MLSRDFPLPQGYTGLVVRVNAPKLSSDVLQQRRPAPLKRKPALSTLAPDPKRHRTSPRKAKPLTRARPKFSMDSDDEQEPVDQEEEEEDGSQPVIDSAQSSQTLVEDPEHQQQQQQQQEEEDPQQEEQVKDVAVQLKPLGKFDEMRIWSADAELDEGQDAIVRNMREWYSMAELVRLLSLLFIRRAETCAVARRFIPECLEYACRVQFSAGLSSYFRFVPCSTSIMKRILF